MTVKDKKTGLASLLFLRSLHTYFLLRRGLTLGVRAVVRSNDGEFLLVRHTYTDGWHFPGGGVEKGEAIIQALKNELEQETGLHLAGQPVLHGVFYNRGVSRRDHIIVYLCETIGSLSLKPASIEIAETGYFHLDALPSNTDPGTARRIREIVNGRELSVQWD